MVSQELQHLVKSHWHPITDRMVDFLSKPEALIDRIEEYDRMQDDISSHIGYLKNQIELFENCKNLLRGKFNAEAIKNKQMNEMLSEELEAQQKEVDF